MTIIYKPEHQLFIEQMQQLLESWSTEKKQFSLLEGFRTRATIDFENQTVCYPEAESQIIWQYTRLSKIYQGLYRQYHDLIKSTPENEHATREDCEYLKRFIQFLFGLKIPLSPENLHLGKEKICYQSKVLMIERKRHPPKRRELLRKIDHQLANLKETERDEFMNIVIGSKLDTESKDILTSILSGPKSFTAIKASSAEEISEAVSLHYSHSLKKAKIKKANLIELATIAFIQSISEEYKLSEKDHSELYEKMTKTNIQRLNKFDLRERLVTFNKVSQLSFLVFN